MHRQRERTSNRIESLHSQQNIPMAPVLLIANAMLSHRAIKQKEKTECCLFAPVKWKGGRRKKIAY